MTKTEALLRIIEITRPLTQPTEEEFYRQWLEIDRIAHEGLGLDPAPSPIGCSGD